MKKSPSPRPMPTTGMPDRLGKSPPAGKLDMKAGVTFGKMQVTNGRKPSDNDRDDR